MKCLVTGGLGFVGRHFVKRLVDDGREVTVVDDASAGIYPDDWAFKPNSGVTAFKFYRKDIREWVKRGPPPDYDLILHCAAVVGGRLKIDGDPIAVATDLAIDADLFQWLTRHRFKGKLVYFSSSAVYPVELQTKAVHVDLSEQLVSFDGRFSMPDQTYGWSKLTGELLARHAAATYGLSIAIYRPFSGYGEDQDLSYPFPAIMQRVADGKNPVRIWSDAVRDFIHIDDVVECVLQTYDKLTPDQPLNIGTGVATSFSQLALMATVVNNSPALVMIEPDKPQGVYYRVADTYNMSQFYQPKVTLEEGIRRSLDFHRKLV